MSLTGFWYLEKISAPTEDGREDITRELLEAFEQATPFEELSDNFHITMMGFQMLLQFEKDGPLTLMMMLEDDELEDPDFCSRYEITEDGCAVLARYQWTENDEGACAEALFFREILNEEFVNVSDGMQPLIVNEDGSLVLCDTLYFTRLQEM